VLKKSFAIIVSFMVIFSFIPMTDLTVVAEEEYYAEEEYFIENEDNEEQVLDEATEPPDMDIIVVPNDLPDVVEDGSSDETNDTDLISGKAPLSAEEVIKPLAAFSWSGTPPATVSSGDTITISGSPTGTLNIPDGATVTIDGTVTNATSEITLNIGAGATVIWNATLQGSSSTYLLNVTGSGTFDMNSNTIVNTGAGGAVEVNGAGATVTVGSGATISSGTGGNGLLVATNDVSVNVNTGGTIESLPGNTSAALQIGRGSNNNITGTVINVNGGSVLSTGTGGYAINDGAGTASVTNDTIININNGIVQAGTACAIHSTGSNSVVTVNGGTVSNAANNNANPAIYMNAGNGNNIFINGGTVESTSAAGYAVQTAGNVVMTGGTVSSINGRAINLVGMGSTATINGGIVQATGTGTAISTATTDPTTVANASVAVNGGTVTAVSGNAINVTGANSSIIVSSGTVSSVSGNAINAPTDATNLAVTVNGTGKVSSTTGYAIRVLGSAAAVLVDANSQVSVMKTGAAIQSGGSITINGGFVFAFGTSAGTALAAPTITPPTASAGMVAVWNQAAGVIYYSQGSHNDLTPIIGTSSNLTWYYTPNQGSGISYVNGTTAGFFPLSLVTVVNDNGLIFDTQNGLMYSNINGSGIPGGANIQFFIGSGTEWSGVPGTLSLNGFSWNTGAPVALTIYGGPATIQLTAGTNNNFASIGTQTTSSAGIQSDSSITIQGGGSLSTAGGNSSTSSNGIDSSQINIISGTIEAIGSTGALSSVPNLPIAYTYWTSIPLNGGTAVYTGTPSFGTPLVYDPNTMNYIRISSGPFAVIDNVTISGLAADTPMSTQQADATIYGAALSTSLVGQDVSSWFPNLPDGITVTVDSVTVSGDTTELVFNFSGTPLEALDSAIDLIIPGSETGGTDITVIPNPDARYAIKNTFYLIVVDGSGSDRYLAGTTVNITANAAPAGEVFDKWVISMGDGSLLNAFNKSTTYTMSAGNAVVTALYKPIPVLQDPPPNNLIKKPPSDPNNPLKKPINSTDNHGTEPKTGDDGLMINLAIFLILAVMCIISCAMWLPERKGKI